MSTLFTKKRMLPAVAVLGLVTAIAIVKSRPDMAHSQAEQKQFLVNTISTEPMTIRPSIAGFGTVEPDIQLPVKAEVSGKITYLHPSLKKGALLPAGTLLIKIDDKDYQLALKQASADVLANKQSYQQLLQTVENTKLDLQLAKQKLSVVEAEFQRKQGLNKQGSVSQSELDAQKQAVLQLKQEVQNLDGRLTTLPADLEVVNAKIDIAQAKVEQAERNIERTQISLPFSSRISAVNVEQNQFVSTGGQLFEASSFDKMLVNAQFSVHDFRKIMSTLDRKEFNIQRLLTQSQSNHQLALAGLSAVIQHPTDKDLTWQAKVERIADNLDPQTRTIGVIVSVSNNFSDLDPEKKPPLVKGMYLSVTLQGKADKYVLVPRAALKGETLLHVDDQQTLQKQHVIPQFTQGDIALFKPIELANKQVVVSELFPAVQGMKVKVEKADKVEQQLQLLGEQSL